MLRSFVVFLLLIVVFLGGMLVGIDRGHIMVNHDDRKEVEISAADNEDEETQYEKQVVQVADDEYLTNEEEPIHLTQKTASLLEAGVKGFYEVIVQVLYQISQLFY